jgi:hypothetical protein
VFTRVRVAFTDEGALGLESFTDEGALGLEHYLLMKELLG